MSGPGVGWDLHGFALPDIRGVDLIREMYVMAETDETVGAILYCILSTMRQVSWRYVPQVDGEDAPEDAEAKKWADLATTMLKDMDRPFDDHVEDGLTMLWAGYAPIEMVFKRRDGVNSRFSDNYYGIGALNLLDQTTVWNWKYEDKKPVAMVQSSIAGGGGLIPLSKVLLYRTTAQFNNPRGRPLLKNAWRVWRLKRKVQDSEAIGIERELCGLPIFEMPEEVIEQQFETDDQGKSTQEAIRAQRMVQAAQAATQDMRLNRSGGLVIPSDPWGDDGGSGAGASARRYNFRIQTTGGQRSIDSRTTARDYDHAIARVAMMQFLTLGQRSGGSYSLSDDQSSMAVSSIMALADKFTAEWNAKAVSLIWAVNLFPERYRPRLEHSEVSKTGIVQIGQFFSGLARASALWGPDVKMRRAIAGMANLPYDNEAQERAAATFQEAEELKADPPEPSGPMAPPEDEEEDEP